MNDNGRALRKSKKRAMKGKGLKRWRKGLTLSVKDVSDQLGIFPSSIKYLERGYDVGNWKELRREYRKVLLSFSRSASTTLIS